MADIPDVDAARDRLGNLLKSIRNQSQAVPNGKRSPSDDEEGSDFERSEHDDSSQRRSTGGRSYKGSKFSPMKTGGPGSISSGDAKKKRRSQKKIIFELRQKAFEIQNPSVEHGLYALCRIWMRGKHTKDSVVTGRSIDRSTMDYNQEALLAANAITRKSTVHPEFMREDATKVTGNETSAQEILNQYLPRWRKTKKDWCQQRNKADVEKYGDSLRVLCEMFATAQNHVITI